MNKRLAWYLWTIPLVLALLVVAFKLIGLSVTTQSAIAAYNRGAYETSAQYSESLLDLNVVEQYIPYFNRGDAYAAGEYYVESIDDFEKALELAPEAKKCDVRVNLALSWEKLGDIYAEGGFFQGAVLLYETAEAVIEEGGEDCTPPQQSSDDLDAAGDRVEEKKEDAEARRDAANEGQEGEGSTEDKLDELGEQEDAGAQEKADGEARDRGEGEGGTGYTDKPW